MRGGKFLQTNIAMAAFNYVSDAILIAAVRRYGEWEAPDSVRLFVNRENDECGFSELEWRAEIDVSMQSLRAIESEGGKR